jgi:hypothetical protein
MSDPESFQSLVVVVVHATSSTVLRLLSLFPAGLFPFCAGVPAIGVGHEPQSVSDMRCADARSRYTDRPDGVISRFHISLNKVEPTVTNRSANLFSKDD